MTATELKKRAIALAEKTKIDSVTPEEVGQLSNDIVEYIENVEINGSSLGIRKTYTSVSAMEADSTAPKDDKGVLLRRGMLVNIYNQEDPDSADNGKVFSFQNPGWAFRGTVDAGYATKEELTELQEEQNETKKQVSLSVKSVNNDETKVLDSSEEFSFCDSKGNVIAKINSQGLKAIAFLDKDGNEIKNIDVNKIKIENITSDKESDRFVFCDKFGKILAFIDSKGIKAVQFIDKEGNTIKYLHIETSREEEFVFCDKFGNVIAKIDNKGIHSINIKEDTSEETKSGWLNGKTIFSLCDSLGAGGGWQKLLAEMSGAKFDQELNGSQENMNNGASLSQGGSATLNTLFYGYEGQPKGLASQQQRAMNFVSLDESIHGTKDFLLIENINDLNYFRDVDKAEDISTLPSVFIKHTPIYKNRIFATAVEARNFFLENYTEVLSSIDPNVGTSLNFQLQTNGYDLTINNSSNTEGTFTVKIGSESYPITINSGMSAEEIAQAIYTFRFNGFKTSLDGATLKFTAESDEYIEAVISCETTTNVTYSLNRTESGIGYYQWLFMSKDINDWLDIDNWKYSAVIGFVSAVKGLFEYLATETPKTKLIYLIAPRFMHKWNKFLRADGTIDMEAYNNDTEVKTYEEFIKAQIKVCELYNIEYINLAKDLGWNQSNMKRVYGESTIHWNNNGNIDIANYLFRKLN